MKKDKDFEKAINSFIDDSEELEENEQLNEKKNNKKIVLDEREGLIERVDRVYVTNDGRQLLRERY